MTSRRFQQRFEVFCRLGGETKRENGAASQFFTSKEREREKTESISRESAQSNKAHIGGKGCGVKLVKMAFCGERNEADGRAPPPRSTPTHIPRGLPVRVQKAVKGASAIGAGSEGGTSCSSLGLVCAGRDPLLFFFSLLAGESRRVSSSSPLPPPLLLPLPPPPGSYDSSPVLADRSLSERLAGGAKGGHDPLIYHASRWTRLIKVA